MTTTIIAIPHSKRGRERQERPARRESSTAVPAGTARVAR